jgi:hypothetical protein
MDRYADAVVMEGVMRSMHARGCLRAGRAPACVVAALALAGCAGLLPTAKTEVTSGWSDFDKARATVERIVPYRTSAGEMKAMGIDPYATPNVQVLTYSDILLRFPLSGTTPLERLDRGLRECLEAGKSCAGYSITARETRRHRVGDFWLDALDFKRVVEVTGWSFNALILVVNDRVVYVIHGGQPLIHELETTRQPLGPLQGWGDMLPGAIR